MMYLYNKVEFSRIFIEFFSRYYYLDLSFPYKTVIKGECLRLTKTGSNIFVQLYYEVTKIFSNIYVEMANISSMQW